MKQQLLTAWQIGNNHTVLLINELSDNDLLACLGKSKNIGKQLAHMHNVRLGWLEHTGRLLYDKSLLIQKDAVLNTGLLKKHFVNSGQKVESLIDQSWENEGKLPSFKTGLIPFITYLVAHESHHRGTILQVLKQNGKKLSNTLKFGIWEWDKLPDQNI